MEGRIKMKKCETCDWWKDYEDRVFALIPKVYTTRAANAIELRHCKYKPHPMNQMFDSYYTAPHYVCNEWTEIVKD